MTVGSEPLQCFEKFDKSQLLRFRKSGSDFCTGVSVTVFSSKAKNWESVMPKAVHSFSSDGIVGRIFLRYQEEIVD